MEMNSKCEKCRIWLLNRTFRHKLSALLWEVPAGPHRAVGVWSSCPKGLLCGRVSKNDVCVCVSVSLCVCTPSVAIKNDQVLNGKSSLSKVSGSKRDPKRDQIDGLIARFWDVGEISGIHCNWRIIWLNDVFRIIETWRSNNRETHNTPFGRLCSACLI